jgi:alpha-glutamyl/putrescinyl thymine pyrophosphorylase clade 1
MKKITLHIKKKPPKPTKVFDTYWKFASERQAIFFRRLLNNTPEWTKDPVLERHKFTNVYRASDRVSQYLIRNVIYSGSQNLNEVFFRLILFKTFNKIATWELLKNKLGKISYKDYSFKQYDSILKTVTGKGIAIYSGAYIMASGKSKFGYDRKYQNHLKLIELMMREGVPQKITESKKMEDVFKLLKSYPTIGNFLAYQYSIDINYSELTNFSEMEFVMPGPGALNGIRKCFNDFGDYSESDIIRYMTDIQEEQFQKQKLQFQKLWGRPLQLIDCQNLFCEVDKYARVVHPNILGLSNRKRIKQLFHPNSYPIEYWFPPKWNINQQVKIKIN